jgi:AraC-like DNA-binding protein
LTPSQLESSTMAACTLYRDHCLPKVFDVPLSGPPVDCEPRALGATFRMGDLRLVSLPPGEVEASLMGARGLLDIHVAGPPGRYALDSDRIQSFAPSDNSIGFLPGGSQLRLHCLNTKPNLLLFFDRKRLLDLAPEYEIDATRLSPQDWRPDAAIGDLAKYAIYALQHADGNRLFVEGLALAITGRWLSGLSPRAASNMPTVANSLRMGRAMDYVNAHLGEDVQIADMAGAASLSPFHFARAFKVATGETPHAYLLRRRIEEASRLLRYSSLSIAHIALQCGFSSQAHLSSAFKRATAMTPARYRQQG